MAHTSSAQPVVKESGRRERDGPYCGSTGQGPRAEALNFKRYAEVRQAGRERRTAGRTAWARACAVPGPGVLRARGTAVAMAVGHVLGQSLPDERAGSNQTARPLTNALLRHRDNTVPRQGHTAEAGIRPDGKRGGTGSE